MIDYIDIWLIPWDKEMQHYSMKHFVIFFRVHYFRHDPFKDWQVGGIVAASNHSMWQSSCDIMF